MFDLFPKQEQQDYPIFGKFCHHYGSKITSICYLMTKFKIHVYTLDQYFASADDLPKIEDVQNQLFACFVKNDTMRAETTVAGIVFTQSLIDELGLTESEQFAAIAHEIGHILYFYSKNRDLYSSGQGEEIYADAIACKIGLADSMLSTIVKLERSKMYSDNQSLFNIRKTFILNMFL
jgi:hypothetical protein